MVEILEGAIRMKDKNLPESWNEAKSAMRKVISTYQAFVYSVKELCDLLDWEYEYQIARLLPVRKFDRLKTDHFQEVFESQEEGMKEAMFDLDKRRKGLAKKQELMAQFNLTEEEIDTMLEAIKTN
jgi:hypothetical protein